MKSHSNFFIYFFALFSLSLLAQQSARKFGRHEILEDLDYLKNSLIEAHYDLYAYTSKDEFSKNYLQIRNSMTNDSVTPLEATTIFQKVISKVNNGHTEISFPAAAYREYALSHGTLFPLEIAFEEGKALIRKNWSDKDGLKAGTEIISINNLTIQEVLQKIYPLISAERNYLKLAKVELLSFPRLYWQAFGEQENFVVGIKEGGSIKKYKLQSINLIEDYEMKRNEIFSEKRELQLLSKYAYLKPGNFSGDEEEFKRFIDSSFLDINKSNVANLIIDLRNNLGGDNSFSDYLVSYIADKPFQWSSEFTLKTSALLKAHTRKNCDTSNPYWQSVLTHQDGIIYTYEFEAHQPQPKEKRFLGKVYVLVNRQSHSQAAVTAAQIQDYKFGIIVGEETGDYPSLYASQFQYNLPKTGIAVKVAKGKIIRVNGSIKQEGVLPDIRIRDHLLDEEDEVVLGLLKELKGSL
ncbi:S41 family peptidase [Croceiramulus getboli]|nr:S41 family peptidase [Flavobacteriaceae bacterium YJPT1-3]